jgi:hypothetical protein
VYNGKTYKVRDAPLKHPIKDECYTNMISIAMNPAQDKIEIGTAYHLDKNGNPESKFSLTFIDLKLFGNQLI